MPMKQQGKYVLILKFSEVYFNSPGEKIFDVAVGNLKVISQLDIYSKVGKATAYDEYVELEFKNGKIYVEVIFYLFGFFCWFFISEVFIFFCLVYLSLISFLVLYDNNYLLRTFLLIFTTNKLIGKSCRRCLFWWKRRGYC